MAIERISRAGAISGWIGDIIVAENLPDDPRVSITQTPTDKPKKDELLNRVDDPIEFPMINISQHKAERYRPAEGFNDRISVFVPFLINIVDDMENSRATPATFRQWREWMFAEFNTFRVPEGIALSLAGTSPQGTITPREAVKWNSWFDSRLESSLEVTVNMFIPRSRRTL